MIVNVTPVYKWLVEESGRINLLKGGAGSSKSYSMAQYIILNKLCKYTNRVILVVRKTLPALRRTAMKLVLDLIDEYEIPYTFNKTDLILNCRGNLVYFLSLDDPEKIKSMEANDIWVEEATEITLEDYRQLKLRMRRKGVNNQMFLSFNPIDGSHWLKTEIADKGIAKINNSTHLDNVFLDEVYRNEIKNLINEDENYYRIYALGEWGILENLIYTSWQAMTEPPVNYKDISYGIDWGFESHCALVRVYWLDGDRVIWEELIYERKLTIPEFIEKTKSIIPEAERQKEFYAGTDEPGSIEEFYKAGFNIHKAVTDVRDGINWCKSHLVGLIGANLIKEAQGYKRKEDKNGNVLEEPVKFMDHALDAGRYATYSIVKGNLGESIIEDFTLR
jgi:phage terminase large subunit